MPLISYPDLTLGRGRSGYEINMPLIANGLLKPLDGHHGRHLMSIHLALGKSTPETITGQVNFDELSELRELNELNELSEIK